MPFLEIQKLRDANANLTDQVRVLEDLVKLLQGQVDGYQSTMSYLDKAISAIAAERGYQERVKK
jgi:hypothetical protein